MTKQWVRVTVAAALLMGGIAAVGTVSASAQTPGQAAAVAVDGASSDGTAVDGTTIEQLVQRIDRLQRDIRTLHMQLATGTPPVSEGQGNTASSSGAPATGASGTAADSYTLSRFDERISALEDDVRQQTGVTETLTYKVEQLTQRLDKLVADVDFRLTSLENRVSGGGASSQPLVQGAPTPGTVERAPASSGEGTAVGAPAHTLGTISKSQLDKSLRQDAENQNAGGSPSQGAVASAPSVPTTPTTPSVPGEQTASATSLPKGDAKTQYKYVFGLLSDGKYDAAETALKAFIAQNGKDPLVDNARYWLGETFYVRAQYVPAAKAFLDAYQKAPKGAKAPDSLLKLGMSLGNLGKKTEACAAFSKVSSEYPKARTPILTTLKREEAHYGCAK